MRVKCLAQEHNTMSPARARTRTARSGDERTNQRPPRLPLCISTRSQNGGGELIKGALARGRGAYFKFRPIGGALIRGGWGGG